MAFTTMTDTGDLDNEPRETEDVDEGGDGAPATDGTDNKTPVRTGGLIEEIEEWLASQEPAADDDWDSDSKVSTRPGKPKPFRPTSGSAEAELDVTDPDEDIDAVGEWVEDVDLGRKRGDGWDDPTVTDAQSDGADDRGGQKVIPGGRIRVRQTAPRDLRQLTNEELMVLGTQPAFEELYRRLDSRLLAKASARLWEDIWRFGTIEDVVNDLWLKVTVIDYAKWVTDGVWTSPYTLTTLLRYRLGRIIEDIHPGVDSSNGDPTAKPRKPSPCFPIRGLNLDASIDRTNPQSENWGDVVGDTRVLPFETRADDADVFSRLLARFEEFLAQQPPTRPNQVMYLEYVKGLDDQEIANRLKTTVGNVHVARTRSQDIWSAFEAWLEDSDPGLLTLVKETTYGRELMGRDSTTPVKRLLVLAKEVLDRRQAGDLEA